LCSRQFIAQESYVSKQPTCWHISTNTLLWEGGGESQSRGRILQIYHRLSSLLWRANILIHLVKLDRNNSCEGPSTGGSTYGFSQFYFCTTGVYRLWRSIVLQFWDG
jgi:hypothetical protein